MSWFDVLKVQQRLFDEPPLTEEQEAVLDEGLEENPFLRPKEGKDQPAHKDHKKPKKSQQKKLTTYGQTTYRGPVTNERDTSVNLEMM